ncbi:hypothetical protein K6982_01075 [Xanthomonas cucurbitae]|nr:hypothetical protein EBN15_01090 [Xanthomonas cucurbitae]WDM75678.1 hypothetical protein K6982_01075 [Xanthomonas cucurbitae]
MMRVALLAVLLLSATLALVWFDPARPPAHIAGTQTLTHAQFVLSAQPLPPTHGWHPVTLPDSWRARRPTTSGMAWYRIAFTLQRLPAAPQALYLPRLAMAGELWLNGALLSPYTPLALPRGASSQGRDAPMYVVLPSSAFRVGGNTLTIRLRGDAQVRSGLSAVRLGPVERIAPVWQRQHLLQVVLPLVQVLLLGAAVCLAYAYAQRRRNYLMMVIGLGLGVMSLVLDLLPPLSLSPGDRHAVRILVFTSVVWLLCRGGLYGRSEQSSLICDN